MAGTSVGGKKAAETNKRVNGKNFYAIIGRKGGLKTGMKGFALNIELARSAGKIGGTISRRGRATK